MELKEERLIWHVGDSYFSYKVHKMALDANGYKSISHTNLPGYDESDEVPFEVYTFEKFPPHWRVWEPSVRGYWPRAFVSPEHIEIQGLILTITDHSRYSDKEAELEMSILQRQKRDANFMLECADLLEVPLVVVCLREENRHTDLKEWIGEALLSKIDLLDYHPDQYHRLADDLVAKFGMA